MTEARGFTIDIDQNSYLPVDGPQVDAIVTVTMTEGTGGHRDRRAGLPVGHRDRHGKRSHPGRGDSAGRATAG
jgi:hypothetical protein